MDFGAVTPLNLPLSPYPCMNYIELSHARVVGLRQLALHRLPGRSRSNPKSIFKLGFQKPDNLHFPGLPADFEQGKRNRQLKAPRPGTAWVQIQDSCLK